MSPFLIALAAGALLGWRSGRRLLRTTRRLPMARVERVERVCLGLPLWLLYLGTLWQFGRLAFPSEYASMPALLALAGSVGAWRWRRTLEGARQHAQWVALWVCVCMGLPELLRGSPYPEDRLSRTWSTWVDDARVHPPEATSSIATTHPVDLRNDTRTEPRP